MKILLDYVFPITAITPTAQASTGYLKQVLAVVKPKAGVTSGTAALCTTQSQIAALTDNVEALQLLGAGLSRVYVLAMSDLNLAAYIAANASNFFTILISSDFSTTEVDAGAFTGFKGVIGYASTNDTWLGTWAAIENRVGFHSVTANKAKNMFYAFGALLSNSLRWRNQQYISMPFADDIDTLGEANTLFDSKISFVISDDEYGNRLGLFAAGGCAIVAPYILKNLQIDLQSKALAYITANEPAYTKKQAALLEDELDKVVKIYITNESIESGDVSVTLESDNFVASGEIVVTQPKALWRIFGEMRQAT